MNANQVRLKDASTRERNWARTFLAPKLPEGVTLDDLMEHGVYDAKFDRVDLTVKGYALSARVGHENAIVGPFHVAARSKVIVPEYQGAALANQQPAPRPTVEQAVDLVNRLGKGAKLPPTPESGSVVALTPAECAAVLRRLAEHSRMATLLKRLTAERVFTTSSANGDDLGELARCLMLDVDKP